jgi:hypothetical protein
MGHPLLPCQEILNAMPVMESSIEPQEMQDWGQTDRVFGLHYISGRIKAQPSQSGRYSISESAYVRQGCTYFLGNDKLLSEFYRELCGIIVTSE